MEDRRMLECSCNCGAVRFRISAPVTALYQCHCSVCRRFSGGSGLPVAIVGNKDFAWLDGAETVRVWKKPGAEWEANFCAICGSAVPGRNDPAQMFVPAGLLPGDLEGVAIRHHIFTGSKAVWDEICDGGKQHDGAFTG